MNPIGSVLTDSQPSRKASCGTHGEYDSRNVIGSIWTRCPLCINAEREEEDERKAKEKREVAERRWLEQLERASIPERFREKTLSNYVADGDGQRRALGFACAYSDDFKNILQTGRGALFLGMPGTGKTHLACGIANYIMRRGYSALFLTVAQALRSIKDSWRRDSGASETKAIALLAAPDLLILDEVGLQFGSETEKMMLFEILNERYVRRRPTILMSNLTIDEVRGYLGDRIMDRLREDGAEVVPFAWDSYRVRA